MSLLHEAIQDKKFDTRMIEKNLVRNVISDKELKTSVEKLADDAENAIVISLDDIDDQN
jgi:hypothetical protein